MMKIRALCNRLIRENKVRVYDMISYAYPMARMKTLDTGIGHPVIYQSKLAPTISTNGGGAVVVYED